MTQPVPLAEIWRGPFLESVHLGHAVIADAQGDIVASWGDPEAIILSRSASKMIQALPLLRSGAADAIGLSDRHLALACASHSGAAIHTGEVRAWLAELGLGDSALRCGPQEPSDRAARDDLILRDKAPCQIHNNCSGKHAGFLTLTAYLKADTEYIDPHHPVQKMVRATYEEVTQEPTLGFGIDGCSAPNFACSLSGMARAMAHFAAADQASPEARLHRAMRVFPELVAGEGKACTALMRAMGGKVAVKTGAEGFYTAILPEKGLGIALKITDGATRGAECAIAAILVRLGALEADNPTASNFLNQPMLNRAGRDVGWIRAAPTLI
ncbi:MAG: asparaginase [Pseudomonadota bacterium]